MLAHYAVDGPADAPVALMLHGWGSSSAAFGPLAAHLAGRYRAVRLDLPGFGGTEPPPETWHIADYAAFVRAFLDKLGLPEPEVLIGHSFGGRVTIKAVGQEIIRPAHVILMGSAGIRHSQSARNQLYKVIAKTGKAITALPVLRGLRANMRRRLYQRAGATDYLDAGPLRQIFLNTINEDLQADAVRIQAPTLLIWGEHDTEAPVADGRLLAQRIPRSTLHIIPGAGHYVFNDAVSEVQKLIDEILA